MSCGLLLAPAGYAQTKPPSAWSTIGLDNARRAKSVVVRAQSDFVADAHVIRQKVLAEMFTSAITELTKTKTVGEAWHQILRPDDIVGVKFNPYGASELQITIPLATILLDSLIQAGWTADQIVLADAPEEIVEKYATRRWTVGWSEEALDFGSGSDQLSSFVEQVTAIINVPLLKDDNIVGLSGCLKNITYNLIKHPARYHAGRCTPYLADIYALTQISGKLRLNVMNGLRTVYHNGPLVVDRVFIDDTGLLLMGRDPLAVDAVALRVLNQIRAEHELEPISLDSRGAAYLVDAAAKSLGHIDLRKIERRSAPDY